MVCLLFLYIIIYCYMYLSLQRVFKYLFKHRRFRQYMRKVNGYYFKKKIVQNMYAFSRQNVRMSYQLFCITSSPMNTGGLDRTPLLQVPLLLRCHLCFCAMGPISQRPWVEPWDLDYKRGTNFPDNALPDAKSQIVGRELKLGTYCPPK